MARLCKREVIADFSVFVDDYGFTVHHKAGEMVLCIPGCDTETQYCIGEDVSIPLWVDKRFLSSKEYEVSW